MTAPQQNLIRPDIVTLLDILADYQIAELTQLNAELKEAELYASYSGQYGQSQETRILAELRCIGEDLAITSTMRDYIVNSSSWDDAAVPLVDLTLSDPSSMTLRFDTTANIPGTHLF